MTDNRTAQIAQLRAEIAALKQAVAALAAMPDMRGPLEAQLAEKQRALATLQGQDAPAPARTHQQTIAPGAQVGTAIAGDVHGNITNTQQSGGVNFGSGNTIGQVGDIVAGNQVRGGVENPGRIDGPAVGVNMGTIIYGRTPDSALPEQPAPSEAAQAQKLLANLKRRLYALQLQAATTGINTRPEMQIEIEDLEAQIARLEG